KINHLNQKKTDSFMEALLGKRTDLAGLPFAMGDACRTKGDRSRQFQIALATVRQALGQQVFFTNKVIKDSSGSNFVVPVDATRVVPASTPGTGNRDRAEQFW